MPRKKNAQIEIDDAAEQLQKMNLNTEKKVKFGAPQEHVFDKQDAPSINIYDIVSTKKVEQRRRVSLGPHEVVDSSGDIEQDYSILQSQMKVEETFDTKTMTNKELIDALQERGLATNGTKQDKIRRLERALVKEGHAPSPQSEKKIKISEEDLRFEIDDEIPTIMPMLSNASVVKATKTYSKRKNTN